MDNMKKNRILAPFNLLYKINPEFELKLMFLLKCKYRLNLKNPKTFNEKLQWIKLYDKNKLMPECCDKYTVRKYVESKGCGEILNDLIWEGFDPNDIPFDTLPKKCVIKITHGSTYNIICTDTSKLDRNEVISKCSKWLKSKFLLCYGEWFYGVVKPRIIIEKFIEGENGKEIKDYKVFCFNGNPEYIEVHSDRFTKHSINVYDKDWNYISYAYADDISGEIQEKPDCLYKMLKYAEILSADFKHARVDFYIENNKIIFGEITFTDSAGFCPYTMSYNLEMGSKLKLE